MTKRIFISYRRHGVSQATTARIYAELVKRFRAEDIFLDTKTLVIGNRFPDEIKTATQTCEVELIVIGPDWLDAVKQPGNWARREIEFCLERELDRKGGMLPLLVDDERMPQADGQTDEMLRRLTDLHALPVRNGNDFENDMSVVIRRIHAILSGSPHSEPPSPQLAWAHEAKTLVFTDHEQAMRKAVELLQALPPLSPGTTMAPVEMTMQGAKVFRSIASIHQEWLKARIAALQHGWSIQPYWRLSRHAIPSFPDRTVTWVLELLQLLHEGSGTPLYEPHYFMSEPEGVVGLLRAPYELMFIPAYGHSPAKAILFFAVRGQDYVDSALLIEDPLVYSLLHQHFHQMTRDGATRLLFTPYPSAQRTGFLQAIEARETGGSGRLLFKPDLAVLTIPEWFYRHLDSPWVKSAKKEDWDLETLVAQQKRRMASLDNAKKKRPMVMYRDICSLRALRRWAETGVYSVYQTIRSPLQVEPYWIREHLRNAINILNHYPNYEIGLLDDDPHDNRSLPQGSGHTDTLWMVAGQGEQQAVFIQFFKQPTNDAALSEAPFAQVRPVHESIELTRDLQCDEQRVAAAFREYFMEYWNGKHGRIITDKQEVTKKLRALVHPPVV